MMKKLFAKKQLMMVALVAALGVAVYLNYYLSTEPSLEAGAPVSDITSDTTASDTSEENAGTLGEATFVGATVSTTSTTTSVTGGQTTGTTTSSTGMDYFDTARDNRTAAREQALSILQEVLDNTGATAEEKAAAGKKAEAIATNVLQESNIESLIVAKGFADSVVYIDGDSCSVVVKCDDLQQQESLQIMEIVVSQAGIAPENVQIMAPRA